LKKIIRRNGARIRGYKANRKLKKSGYPTWRHYKHNRDPDVVPYANTVEDFYKNYPYVYAIRDYRHYAFKCVSDYGPFGTIYGYDEMTAWCEEKIRWNYRRDIHRVLENYRGRDEFNDVGGSDIVYFAFKNEKDFMHFLLRWA